MFECIITLTPALTVLTALFTAGCAAASFWLANKIYREAKTDERLIFGPMDHPFETVPDPEHHKSILGCAVFNKSHRKAFIKDVAAYTESRTKVEITWSGAIDRLGVPQEPRALIGIVDTNSLYIRRNDGESFDYARIVVTHSFRGSPHIHFFDPVSELE